MFEEDKVVYNSGSIKIKVIRGEMGERERGVGAAAAGLSVRPFVMCLPQKLVNFELIICLASRGMYTENGSILRTIIALPNSHVSHGGHKLLLIND